MKKPNPFERFLTPEQKCHKQLVDWLKWVKPGEWFHYPAEGKRTPFERYLWSIMGGKQSVSDFVFFDHRHGFCGLLVELKAPGTKIFRDDGIPLKDMIPQWEYIERMKKLGWTGGIYAGFDDAHKAIADYYELH